MKCKSASAFFFFFFLMFMLREKGQEVNGLLLMRNLCTFSNIPVFSVFVKSVEPNNNKFVFKLIGKLMV